MAKAPRTPGRSDLDLEHQRLDDVRDDAERRHILSVLELARGSRVQAAHILGISRKTLWKKLKRLGVQPPDVTER